MNGRVALDPDHWVDWSRDRITLDGKPVEPAAKWYILLHKPKGYLTTLRDPQGRPTVYDLLTAVDTWVFPVGRLDLDTSGLLLLTNDTGWAESIASPAQHVAKTYVVRTASRLGDAEAEQLRQGILLRDGPTRPAQVKRLRDAGSHTTLEITITEGRNRQVRRMIEAVGSKVDRLVRTSIGPVKLGDLAPGAWRRLTPEEVTALAGGVTPSTSESRRNPKPAFRGKRNRPARRS